MRLGSARISVGATLYESRKMTTTTTSVMRILLDKQMTSGIIGALRVGPGLRTEYERGRLRVVSVIIEAR